MLSLTKAIPEIIYKKLSSYMINISEQMKDVFLPSFAAIV